MSTEHAGEKDVAGERQRLWEEVRGYHERRAVIEQAKGMLMFVLTIDADEAFHVLRAHSQQRNIKLHLVAEQIQKDLIELAAIQGPARKVAFDRVIGAARQRVDDVVDRQLNGESKTGVPMKDILNRA